MQLPTKFKRFQQQQQKTATPNINYSKVMLLLIQFLLKMFKRFEERLNNLHILISLTNKQQKIYIY